MNSTMISARLRTPVGALVPSRLPASRKMTMPISAAATAIRAILLNVGKRSFQRRIALIGGNSSANTCDPFLYVDYEWVRAGLRPGWAREMATYFSSQNSSPRCVTMMVAPRAGSEIHDGVLTR